MNLNPNLRPHNKTISDEFRSNVRAKTKKLLEENIGEHLHDLEEENNLSKKPKNANHKGKSLINYTILKFKILFIKKYTTER